MLKDDSGLDHGVLTGAGVAIASAVMLLIAFSVFRATIPADSTISLCSAVEEINGDIGMVASMALPYACERTYGLNGIDVSITPEYISASDGSSVRFARPLVIRVYPGRYGENGSVVWNNTTDMRRYLNDTLGAPGTEDRPIDERGPGQLTEIMEKAGRSMIYDPLTVKENRPLIIEKAVIYSLDSRGKARGASYVFVHQ